MKRLIAMMLLLAMCMGMTAAHAEGAELTWSQAAEMAMYMRSLAWGDYMDIHGVPQELQSKARTWTDGITQTPRLVVRLDVENEPNVVAVRTSYLNEHPMVSFEAQSSAMGAIIAYSMLYAEYEDITAQTSYDETAAINTAIDCEMLYADKAEPGTALYVVLYDNAQPLFILASAENDAVSLRGYLIPSRLLAKSTNYGQVALWFMRYGFPMTGQEITAP